MKRAKISYDAAVHGYTFFVTNSFLVCKIKLFKKKMIDEL